MPGARVTPIPDLENFVTYYIKKDPLLLRHCYSDWQPWLSVGGLISRCKLG